MDFATVTGKGSLAFGLYINIQDTRQITDVEKSEAEHKAQVAVKVGDITKEFTLSQFLELLGFEAV